MLFVRKVTLKTNKMKAELNELRYCLEQNVERRTEHLLIRIALLESCNETLCNKLALYQEELAGLRSVQALQKQTAVQYDYAMKLCALNLKRNEPTVQEQQWEEHASAA